MLARTTLKQGPGTPLVFLHGFLGSAADWEPLCSYLPPCQCVGLDLPGHGKSPFMEEFTIDIPSFHLIGYSMGGRIAMAYAKKHPEQIASLTLMSVHPGLRGGEERQNRWKSDQAWAKLLLELPIDDFLNRWYDQPIFKPFIPNLSMRKEQNILGLAAAMLHYSLAKQPYYEIQGVFVGERDHKFRALHPAGIVVPDAGHMVHLENPQFIAAKL